MNLALPDIQTNSVVSEELDGATGSNRGAGHCQLLAQTDREAIIAWLATYESENTLASHRREAERLWLWATRQHGKPVSSLAHEDLLVYKRFLANPQPAEVWITEGGAKFPRQHPEWRPFYRPSRKNRYDAEGKLIIEPVLGADSIRQALTVLNAMFTWLVDAGYLSGNPLALSRRRGKPGAVKVDRYLPPQLWQQVLAYVEELPRETKIEARRYHRARWIVSLFYLGGLRISEAVTNTMGCFSGRRASDGTLQWWLTIVGKGEKTRNIPATSELMAELQTYRKSFDLAPLPTLHERVPLVVRYGPGNREEASEPMTRSALHVAIKQIMEGAATRLRVKGNVDAARELARASAHWLRHTAGSSMADSIDVRMVRDHLGHDSIATTDIYLHTEDDARYREVEAKHRVGWSAPQK